MLKLVPRERKIWIRKVAAASKYGEQGTFENAPEFGTMTDLEVWLQNGVVEWLRTLRGFRKVSVDDFGIGSVRECGTKQSGLPEDLLAKLDKATFAHDHYCLSGEDLKSHEKISIYFV